MHSCDLCCKVIRYLYLSFLLPAGVINTWKKRWFVLKDETLMYFRSKQVNFKFLS